MKYYENYQYVTQRHEGSKCCWENGTIRLAQQRVATNLFIKHIGSVKCSKAKHNKTRYACTPWTLFTLQPEVLTLWPTFPHSSGPWSTTVLCHADFISSKCHLLVKSYSSCLSLIYFRHSQSPSMLLQVTGLFVGFFMAEKMPFYIRMTHSLDPFICWWRLRVFYVLAVAHIAAVHMACRYLFKIIILLPSNIYLEVELLSHTVVLFLSNRHTVLHYDWTNLRSHWQTVVL